MAPNLNDISDLKRANQIKSVKIATAQNVDYRYLCGCTNLLELNLQGNKNLSSLSTDGLTNLQMINVAYTDFTDFEGLLKLPKVREVYINNSMMTEETIQKYKDNGINIITVD